MKWYRITFQRYGGPPINYETCGKDFEEAYRQARGLHVGEQGFNGAVSYIEIDEPEPDKSFTMEDLRIEYGEDLPF